MAWFIGNKVWVPRTALKWGSAVIVDFRGDRYCLLQMDYGKPVMVWRYESQLVARDEVQMGADCPSVSPMEWSGIKTIIGPERESHA